MKTRKLILCSTLAVTAMLAHAQNHKALEIYTVDDIELKGPAENLNFELRSLGLSQSKQQKLFFNLPRDYKFEQPDIQKCAVDGTTNKIVINSILETKNLPIEPEDPENQNTITTHIYTLSCDKPKFIASPNLTTKGCSTNFAIMGGNHISTNEKGDTVIGEENYKLYTGCNGYNYPIKLENLQDLYLNPNGQLNIDYDPISKQLVVQQ